MMQRHSRQIMTTIRGAAERQKVKIRQPQAIAPHAPALRLPNYLLSGHRQFNAPSLPFNRSQLAQTETQFLPVANPGGIMRRMGRIWTWREENAGAFWDEARTVLRRHGIIAVPTETFFGLAVNPFQAEALARLFALRTGARKNRCW